MTAPVAPVAPTPTGPPLRLEVFAVAGDEVQVCWRRLGPGPHVLAAGDVEVVVTPEQARHAGGVALAPLPPGDEVVLRLDGREVARARTLRPPPGPALARVATISDLHVGEGGFGYVPRLHDAPGAEGHSLVCLRAAVAAIEAWGPDLVVVKGDVAHHCADEEYDAACAVLRTISAPLLVVPGNHDGGNHAGADIVAALARNGLTMTTGVATVDLPGLRVVAANSIVPGKGHGIVHPVLDDVADALGGAAGGALLALHHHPQRTVVPTHWPPGILGFDGHRFLRTVERAHAATLVTAGHTHRHRRRRHGTLAITEVGSIKDFPGTWAGYVAHEAGIQQVVRRIVEPAAIAWTERTAAMGLGQWGRWAPGRLEARCFTHLWPRAAG